MVFPFLAIFRPGTQGQRQKVRKVGKTGRHNKGEMETEKDKGRKAQDCRGETRRRLTETDIGEKTWLFL